MIVSGPAILMICGVMTQFPIPIKKGNFLPQNEGENGGQNGGECGRDWGGENEGANGGRMATGRMRGRMKGRMRGPLKEGRRCVNSSTNGFLCPLCLVTFVDFGMALDDGLLALMPQVHVL